MQTEKEPNPIDEGRISNQNSNPNIATSDASITVAQFPAKKPTRQWAAWTRQEEESFFTALRQVGKNFEKITSRVQSKNRDQVRHYYYRLVRRMNKLLSPELSLDAKEAKDTNAAMLRWWSLLEKYSCKASKLHLKPRRFKLFIEALEQQLIKDRKKNTRKRSCQEESRILCDTQNVIKQGTVEKEDTAFGKQHRKKDKDLVIDGVSLVADAAEHLERAAKSLCDDTKFKLELYPIDESTRRSLETENHNPHLELTLRKGKKISSVLERLNHKWGSSSCSASGELMLFPYNARKETITCHQKWTNKSLLTAVEVYSIVGSPSTFRLRYGWFRVTAEQVTSAAGEWGDISISDLLSDNECVIPPVSECVFRDDSFDAAIAAHILRHQNKPSEMLSSIWDDEDTRDAFSFQKNNSLQLANVTSHGGVGRVHGEGITGDEGHCNSPDKLGDDKMEEAPVDSHCGFADVYWPDSFGGPFDLEIRSSKYTEDLILGDSLGSLSRLLATSLDAFQNCSLFGFENKKDNSNMVGNGTRA